MVRHPARWRVGSVRRPQTLAPLCWHQQWTMIQSGLPLTMIVGIRNPSTTACHLAAALQIFCHCLKPIRQGLIAYASTTACEDPLWIELARFCQAPDDAPFDPTLLYRYLRQSIGVEAEELGDAVTALARLLAHVRASVPILVPLVHVTSGKVHARIEATQTGGAKRWKETKVRDMTCPFPIVGDCESLQQGLQLALAPQELSGYHWHGSYEEEGRCTEDTWLSTKTLVVDKAPAFWLLHLHRFVSEQGRTVPMSNSIEIAPTIQLPDNHCRYHLQGGILHVSDVDAAEDEEQGHYVSLVRDDMEWYLIDDEESTLVTESQALALLSGSDGTWTKRKGFMRGVLVVYREEHADALVESLFEDLAAQLAAFPARPDPQALIGRRLKVQWAGGKLYAGVVTAYNAVTGKHTVEYDDGDMKHYRLQQKTIEWL